MDTKFKQPKIKVIGIGGGGCNFQEHMIKLAEDGLPEEAFIAVNTDRQSLDASKAKVKLQIGPNGLGAGADPNVGREAAEFSTDEIRELCRGIDLVILFSGFGGGTGSGASEVVARIAREEGALVFGIITKPFDFEGKVRKRVAEESIVQFRKNADVTVVVSNQLLFKITNQYTTFREAFKIIDDMCASFVQSLLGIFNTNGLINVDFADIESTIKNKGAGIIGVGLSDGEDAAVEAVMKALSNPLLENATMKNASNALVHIAGNDISLMEVEAIMQKIHSELGENVNIIHGMTIGNENSSNQKDAFFNLNMKQSEDDLISVPTKWVRVMIIVTGIYQTETKEEEFNIFNSSAGASASPSAPESAAPAAPPNTGANSDLFSSIINNNEEKKEPKSSSIFNLLRKLGK